MIHTKVFALTAVHNDFEDALRLIGSLRKQSYKNLTIIVVDDGSTDNTYEYITSNYPDIKIIKGSGNLWWTGALFAGVREILRVAKKGDYILTLNNDCIFEADYVSNLVEAAQDNEAAIVGSLAIDARDRKTIWDGGVRIDWKKGKFLGIGPKYVGGLAGGELYQKQIDTLSTKGTLYPVEVFHKIGNFDKKNLPHYLSDYEFGLRAKRNGYKLLISYGARIYNNVTKTGIGDKIPGQFSMSYFLSLLFSRRSKVNVIDQWNFIRIACPKKYKPVNYFLVLLKVAHYLLHVPPFTIIPKIILGCKRLLGIKLPSESD